MISKYSAHVVERFSPLVIDVSKHISDSMGAVG